MELTFRNQFSDRAPRSTYSSRAQKSKLQQHEALIRKLHHQQHSIEDILEILANLANDACHPSKSQLYTQMRKWQLTRYYPRHIKPGNDLSPCMARSTSKSFLDECSPKFKEFLFREYEETFLDRMIEILYTWSFPRDRIIAEVLLRELISENHDKVQVLLGEASFAVICVPLMLLLAFANGLMQETRAAQKHLEACGSVIKSATDTHGFKGTPLEEACEQIFRDLCQSQYNSFPATSRESRTFHSVLLLYVLHRVDQRNYESDFERQYQTVYLLLNQQRIEDASFSPGNHESSGHATQHKRGRSMFDVLMSEEGKKLVAMVRFNGQQTGCPAV